MSTDKSRINFHADEDVYDWYCKLPKFHRARHINAQLRLAGRDAEYLLFIKEKLDAVADCKMSQAAFIGFVAGLLKGYEQ